MDSDQGKLAILVGGGPAPGLNSVIGAATIRSSLVGVPVLGIHNGFEKLMQGNTEHIIPLEMEAVGRVHFRGGSILGTSRANPTKNKKHLDNTVRTLLSLGVDKLITIGGDDTAYSAMNVEQASEGKLRVIHVPKTIDNDLDLPPAIDTFGFQTARHVGVQLVENLMTDAKTTPRWYIVVTMGRKAGHLALGIGKAAGATLTLIPEEWPEEKIPLRWIVDTLVCAIIKRKSLGRGDGVAVLAEGLIERIDPSELDQLQDVERDEHGHIRLAEIDFGHVLKREVRKRLAEYGLKVTLIDKEIGYELRCADPIPVDMEYCRDLGYCAAKFIISGGNASMVSIQGGHFVPVSFADMLDPETGRTRVRLVDIRSNRYRVAKRYMIRLRKDEIDDDQAMASYGQVLGMSADAFRMRFAYITEHELPSVPLVGTPS